MDRKNKMKEKDEKDNKKDEIESLKTVLIGESGVGKTSIIQKFVTNKFVPHRQTSLSAQFNSKIVNFKDIYEKLKFDIWDTIGQEKYRSLAKIFYKDAKVIIFVYDVTNPSSLEALKKYWYNETKNNCQEDAIFAVVGNKIDLFDQIKVDKNEGEKFALQIGAVFQQTSAQSSAGIDKLFDNLGKVHIIPDFDYREDEKVSRERYLKKFKDNPEYIDKLKSKGIKLDSSGLPKKKGCC